METDLRIDTEEGLVVLVAGETGEVTLKDAVTEMALAFSEF